MNVFPVEIWISTLPSWYLYL